MERDRLSAYPQVVRFPELLQHEHLSPIGLYERMYPTIPQGRSEVYVPGPVTSGGARRLVAQFADNPDVMTADRLPTVIGINRMLTETVVRELFASGMKGPFTIPTHIEGRVGYKELDINLFWAFYLTGIPPAVAGSFQERLRGGEIVDLDKFNDHGLPHEERRAQYGRFVGGFIDHVDGAPHNPVRAAVYMPDWRTSLGSRAFEFELFRAAGIPVFEVQFNRSHPHYSKSVARNAYWQLMEASPHDRLGPFSVPVYMDSMDSGLVRVQQVIEV